MVLWVVIAVMTALAALAVIAPLVRPGKDDAQDVAAAHDMAVYKDQLAEIDRDLDDGLIEAGEAEAARTEIARRLLRASNAVEDAAAAAPPARRRFAAVVALIGIPLLSGALYVVIGSPDLPDQPLAGRVQQAHGGRDINKLVEGAEAYLQNNPDDGKAWALLAPVYLRLNQGDKAANAFRRAIALTGANATLEIGLGEAIVSAEGGKVGTDAQAAFQRALGHDPAAVEPRFFLAVALNQEQKFPEAVVAWEAFLKDADPREPWVPYARAELAKARKGAGLPPAAEMPPMAAAPVAPMATSPTAPSPTAPSPAAPGPTADDVAAAQDMTQEDRQSMIESMVARLAERLETEGGGAEDWIRLMRAYMVLNRKDDARSAALKAIEAHKDDSAAKAQIENAASGLGIVL